METLKSNVNKMTNYPSKETMELFLKLGNSMGILSNSKNSEGINGYDNINAIITLAVVCDYLCQKGKEKEKQSFLDELKKQGNNYYKTLGELALHIWEQKLNLSPFSQSMIKSNRERLQFPNRTHPYFPVIARNDFPERIQNINYQKMIHKEFEAELARLNGVQSGADRIQAETENHQFSRGDNSKQIDDLQKKL